MVVFLCPAVAASVQRGSREQAGARALAFVGDLYTEGSSVLPRGSGRTSDSHLYGRVIRVKVACEMGAPQGCHAHTDRKTNKRCSCVKLDMTATSTW